MKWFGLTGSIGSGKTTVADLLRSRGVAVLDADHFASQVLQPGSAGEAQVIQEFGPEVVTKTGHLDRAKLGEIVFSDAQKLKILEKIVHPLVREKTRSARAELEKNNVEFAFYDVPLLYEKKMEKDFDGILVVHSPLAICVERVMKRNLLSRENVEKRIKNQLDIETKMKRAHWTIENAGTLEDLRKKTDQFLQDLSRKFKKQD